MASKHEEDFKQEAVRIALTSGLPRRRVASDLGVGFSTLSKWVSQYRPADMSVTPQADLAKENEQLRRENPILKEERDILKEPVLSLSKGPRSSSRANAREVWLYQTVAAIFAYIKGFYNTRRRHSYLRGISPLALEAKEA